MAAEGQAASNASKALAIGAAALGAGVALGVGVGYLLFGGSSAKGCGVEAKTGGGVVDKRLGLPTPLYEYLLRVGTRESKELVAIRELTDAMPQRMMQISPDEGAFLHALVRAIDGKVGIEVGTFTGYSALCFASALPRDGQLHVFDISDEYVSKGRPHWQAAGVSGRIVEHIGDAKDLLAAEVAHRGSGWADFAFIDADKEGYPAYVEACLTALRPGGVLLIDNVIWHGKVADEAHQDPATVTLRSLNAKMQGDARVHWCIVPVGDGVGMAVKAEGTH
ncbi:mdmC [Symbiodinium sp. KB8]|nr:mdmC [Symbiodinium sp. KB8]